jgi:hypothetical protein
MYRRSRGNLEKYLLLTRAPIYGMMRNVAPSETPTDPRRSTAEEVERLWEMGWEVRRIAKSLDVSTQRVYQILKDRDLRDKEPA